MKDYFALSLQQTGPSNFITSTDSDQRQLTLESISTLNRLFEQNKIHSSKIPEQPNQIADFVVDLASLRERIKISS